MAGQPMPVAQAAPLLRAGLEPYRSRVAALAPLYRALSPTEQRRVMAAVSRACSDELRAFYVALSRVTARFQGEEEAKVLVRPTVQTWDASQALWAFELFAQDTVAELKEMAEDESEDESEDDAGRQAAHQDTVPEGAQDAVRAAHKRAPQRSDKEPSHVH